MSAELSKTILSYSLSRDYRLTVSALASTRGHYGRSIPQMVAIHRQYRQYQLYWVDPKPKLHLQALRLARGPRGQLVPAPILDGDPYEPELCLCACTRKRPKNHPQTSTEANFDPIRNVSPSNPRRPLLSPLNSKLKTRAKPAIRSSISHKENTRHESRDPTEKIARSCLMGPPSADPATLKKRTCKFYKGSSRWFGHGIFIVAIGSSGKNTQERDTDDWHEDGVKSKSPESQEILLTHHVLLFSRILSNTTPMTGTTIREPIVRFPRQTLNVSKGFTRLPYDIMQLLALI
ncbi:hypothetical protein XANCAGTX0491_007427 [Xanthoria calcicola]